VAFIFIRQLHLRQRDESNFAKLIYQRKNQRKNTIFEAFKKCLFLVKIVKEKYRCVKICKFLSEMGSISKILDLDESASPKSPVSSDNGFESFDATSSPEHSSANMTKISTESGSDSGRVSSVEDYVMKEESMDESSSNSKNFRPWEVESKTVPESRVPG
jgi:hypothetical protein